MPTIAIAPPCFTPRSGSASGRSGFVTTPGVAGAAAAAEKAVPTKFFAASMGGDTMATVVLAAE